MATVASKSQQHQHQATVVLPGGRKVVDEVSGWLRVLDDGSVDRTWTGPPEALPLMQSVEPYAVRCDMSHSFYLNKFAVEMDPNTGERAQELIDAIKGFIARH